METSFVNRRKMMYAFVELSKTLVLKINGNTVHVLFILPTVLLFKNLVTQLKQSPRRAFSAIFETSVNSNPALLLNVIAKDKKAYLYQSFPLFKSN